MLPGTSFLGRRKEHPEIRMFGCSANVAGATSLTPDDVAVGAGAISGRENSARGRASGRYARPGLNLGFMVRVREALRSK